MIKRLSVLAFCLLLASVSRLGWTMGTPPFDTVLRSFLGEETQSALKNAGCLSQSDAVSLSSIYRRNRSRKPIEGRQVTTSFSFPGRNRKGEATLITVSTTQTTDAAGEIASTRTVAQLLEEVSTALAQNRFYRGVKRVQGQVQISFSTADTLERSVRYSPPDGFSFDICAQ